MKLFFIAKEKFLKLSLFKKALVIGLIILVGWFVATRVLGQRSGQPEFQTAKVERGTLVVSVSESGQVAVANKVNITTSASGKISEVYVSNGDYVTPGQNIATVTLDQAGQQRQAAAWASYLSSKNTLDAANATSYTLQADMFDKWHTFKKLAESGDYDTPEERALPQFHIAEKEWLGAEAKYKNQEAVISQARAAINSAWLSYQSQAATITTPIEGIISDLVMVPGLSIGNQIAGAGATAGTTTTSGSQSGSSQAIASVENEGTPIITINLSEIDVLKVKEGDRVKVTFDALENKEFEGRVAGINRTGTILSGVTTYPATIVLDSENNQILSNMSVSVEIITETSEDILLVPSGAIVTQNGHSSVGVKKGNTVRAVPVVTGAFSDTQTEIISGLSEGDEIIIGTFSSQGQTQQGTSPFRLSPFGGGGGGR